MTRTSRSLHTNATLSIIIGAVLLFGGCTTDDAVISSPAPVTGADGSTIPPTTVPAPEVGALPEQSAATLPPAPAPTTAPPTTRLAPSVVECLSKVPVRTRVAQLVWPATYGEDFRKDIARFAEWGVGGAVVMTFPDQADPKDLLDMKAAGKTPLLLATDEEGGDVQRFRRAGELPSARKVAETMTPAEATQMITAHAVVLKAVGIDIVFAPVVDVSPKPFEDGGEAVSVDLDVGEGDDQAAGSGNGNGNDQFVVSDPMGDRTFGDDPLLVDAYARAYVEGWKAADVLPVLKHFPGHGSASGDTHNGAATTPLLAKLKARDLIPYEDLVQLAPGVMVGHLNVPDLTDAEDVPASLSSAAITDLLRNEYGFDDALVFTDALGMGAITSRFSIPEAAERALVAGADVAIFTATDETPSVIDRLVDAVDEGRLSQERLNESVTRVLRQKDVEPCSL